MSTKHAAWLTSCGFSLLLLAPVPSAAQRTWIPMGRGQDARDATSGIVVFFREKRFAGGGVGFKVRDKGVELCKLRNGTYCIVRVTAGTHEFVVHSEARDVLTLEIDPGETYFVSARMGVGLVAGRPNLSPSSYAEFNKVREKLKDHSGRELNEPDEKE